MVTEIKIPESYLGVLGSTGWGMPVWGTSGVDGRWGLEPVVGQVMLPCGKKISHLREVGEDDLFDAASLGTTGQA